MPNEKSIWFFEEVDLYDILCPYKYNDHVKHHPLNCLNKNDFLFMEGDPAREIFLVADGKVKVGFYDNEGNEQVIAFLGRGEILGEMALFGAAKHREFAQVVADRTMICKLRVEKAQELVRDYVPFSLTVTKRIGERAQRLERRLQILLFKDARQRLVEFIKDLCRDVGKPYRTGIKVMLDITQSDIAALIKTFRAKQCPCFSPIWNRLGWSSFSGGKSFMWGTWKNWNNPAETPNLHAASVSILLFRRLLRFHRLPYHVDKRRLLERFFKEIRGNQKEQVGLFPGPQMRRARQDAQLRIGQRLEYLQGMFFADGVAVAGHDQYGRADLFQIGRADVGVIGQELQPFALHGIGHPRILVDQFDQVRKYRQGVGCEVGAEREQAADFIGVSTGQDQPDDAAVAVAVHQAGILVELVEQGVHVGSHHFIAEVARRTTAFAVTTAVDRDHFVFFGKSFDHVGVHPDGGAVAVQKHHRRAFSINFIVHFDAVQLSVMPGGRVVAVRSLGLDGKREQADRPNTRLVNNLLHHGFKKF